jgi:hypothetical protein
VGPNRTASYLPVTLAVMRHSGDQMRFAKCLGDSLRHRTAQVRDQKTHSQVGFPRVPLDLSHDGRTWRYCGRGALRTWSWKLVKPASAGSALSFDAVLLSIGSSCTVPSVMNTVLMPEARSNDTALMAGFCPVLEPTGSGTRPGADAVACGAREATSSCFASMAVRRSPDASGRVVAGLALPAVSSARSCGVRLKRFWRASACAARRTRDHLALG